VSSKVGARRIRLVYGAVCVARGVRRRRVALERSGCCQIVVLSHRRWVADHTAPRPSRGLAPFALDDSHSTPLHHALVRRTAIVEAGKAAEITERPHQTDDLTGRRPFSNPGVRGAITGPLKS